MQPLEVLDFIEPSDAIISEYGIGSEGEAVASAYVDLMNTNEGQSILGDLLARSGFMDAASDERQNGKRDVALETLMILKTGVENERRRDEQRRAIG